ncbi:DUF637 domain-containing protein [Pseudomonas nitroreducens]|uniref:DUF637 domain-containing protein n=1 Tax=Pseudomonas nitroreducens TaxID=46680 RepID=UPI000464B580|nr:DUF637 domain-containing protein [Pseudomonas nitroreducens]WEW97862.1 DUF637 domain-containing protein [Pseudomonas nitroreducens]SNS10941.1 Possible hemagglutinin [Pseudomonas nitroreducens]
MTGTYTDINTGKISFTSGVGLNSFEGIGRFAAQQALQNGTAAGLSKILGQGGNLGDVLQNTLYNTLAAASFNAVGDYTKGVYADGSIQKIMIHAMVGGLLAEASGGDFKTGALAGGANEALVDQLNTWVGGDQTLLNMTSQLVGVLAAAAQKDATIDDLNKGKWVAENATQYNYSSHWDDFEEDFSACQKNPSSAGCSTILKMAGTSSQPMDDGVIRNLDSSGNVVSYTILGESGQPLMIMEPKEFGLYSQLPVAWQEGYMMEPAWKLDLSSYTQRMFDGEFSPAFDHYGYMLTEPGFWGELSLGVALGVAGRYLPSANAAREMGLFWQSAKEPYTSGQVISAAGRGVTKHPECFGFNSTLELRQIYRSDAMLNELAGNAIQEILQGGVRTAGAGGRYPGGWVTYTLPDGRAASWGVNGEFIGFRGVKN